VHRADPGHQPLGSLAGRERQGCPVNQAATLLAQAFGAGFSIYGTVVIVGLAKDADVPASLSQAQVSLIFQRISGPAA
jgi:hypothetical protein